MYPFKTKIYSKKIESQQLYVYENGIYRWLCFDNIFIQTIINKWAVHRPILKYLPSLCVNLKQKKETVVVLGAGGGAIYHYMSYYYPRSKLTLVEINQHIIEIAHQFFNVNQTIIHKEAHQFTITMPKVEHIFIDVFIDQELPDIIQQRSFLQLCQSKAQRCVSINLLSANIEKINPAITFIREIFRQKTLCLHVKNKSNIIIHAYTQDNYLEHISELTQNKVIEKPLWDIHKGLISILK